MDGCTAAAHVAYALSEVATIYPITPIASMGETADKWVMQGRKNVFGSQLSVKEMESEFGAAGATHGAAAAGALATTFTASQGLMLMIPNMYKISGELLPVVFHVGTRSLATHALSIFGDHQDVMACRATGFTMLASASVQETMDLALVAHLAAIDGSLPVLHFFDGWRTSNEMATIDVIPYSDIASVVDFAKVKSFRDRAMNPDHPDLRGSAQNPDVYFQNREAANRFYDAFPAIVQNAMDRVARITGRQYHLVEYTGAEDATDVVVSIGSSCEVIKDTVAWLNGKGYHAGAVKISLYRPFPTEQFLASFPATVRRIAVLDRTKEPGADGEPLYKDVAAAIQQSGRDIMVIGGRYGLSSKEFNPVMVRAVFDELASDAPRRQFTVGINDDVTHLSLTVPTGHFLNPESDVHQAIFYGMGSDGTVGATRQIASIASDTAGLYAQAFFNYSAKKSGGYTISQLRYAPHPIRAEYSIHEADYVGCNKDIYTDRYELLADIRQGGTFVLNSSWTADEMNSRLPASLRRQIAQKGLRFYNVDARSLAAKTGLGVRINTIMATVYLHLTDTPAMPFATTVDALKKAISTIYLHEGADVVKRNLDAIDQAPSYINEIQYSASWAVATDNPEANAVSDAEIPAFIKDVARPCLKLLGNELPVSALSPDGTLPMGTTAYEKRCIADNIPVWTAEKCVQCTLCSLVCPHASIRPFLLTADEAASAPQQLTTAAAHGPAPMTSLRYRIQVYPADCTGCGSCATICPGKALTMTPIRQVMDQEKESLAYLQTKVTEKTTPIARDTVKGSQMHRPLLQFSGACAGCGETPYVKLLTQLMGERLLIANATGCSSIWGANYPSNAYCTDSNGHGPAWGNSLFEDNAEYGYGMACAMTSRRNRLADVAKEIAADATTPAAVKTAAQAWLDAFDSFDGSASAGRSLVEALKSQPANPLYTDIIDRADMLGRKSVWAIGGDGWAYDIGFGGLDHVLAQKTDINVLVMDTECYSNTGGQTSKATPLGAVMKYAADGKRTPKKDLGRMMMTYGNIYVASVAFGANYEQTINALAEAEAYPGPSIVIAYCPCINHGIRSGMSHSIVEQRLAVQSGYWPLYRFNPSLDTPLSVDAAAPDGSLIQFINGEDRYADLRMIDPAEAAILQPDLQKRTARIYSIIKAQSTGNLF